MRDAPPTDPAQKGSLKTIIRFLPMLWPRGEREIQARVIVAVLLVAFVIVLRVAVAEIKRNRMTPVLYGVIIATILLGLYLLPDYFWATPRHPVTQMTK